MKNDTEILALLLSSNAKVYLKDRTFTQKIVLNGDNIRLDGQGSGLAVSDLVSTTIVNNVIEISGNNCVVRGVRFNANAEHCIKFTGLSNGITFENCIFDGANYPTGIFWYGGGNWLEGDMTLKNCLVQK